MVFVFNLDAIVVALIAVVLLIPIALLRWLNVIDEESAILSGSWALFAASLIATGKNLRGRLFFFFPTWMATLSCALYASYNLFEKVVSFTKIAFVFFLLLLFILLFFLFFQEKKQIKDLPYKILQLPDKNNGMLSYLKGIKELFFFPLFGKWTEDMCEYNIRVLQFLKENDIEMKFSEEFHANLIDTKNNISGGGNQKPDNKIRESFMSEIDHQIKLWK